MYFIVWDCFIFRVKVQVSEVTMENDLNVPLMNYFKSENYDNTFPEQLNLPNLAYCNGNSENEKFIIPCDYGKFGSCWIPY